MSSDLDAVSIDSIEPARLAHFWAGVLAWDLIDEGHDVAELAPRDGEGFRLRFVAARGPKVGLNWAHFDLKSTSPDDQRATVRRSLRLGAKPFDVGQGPDAEHVVLVDPEGNEYCVIEPGNSFLAESGRLGALTCDGSQSVGYFWSDALGWPLIWDQDGETAIRSPRGGSIIAWSGSHDAPGEQGDRLHFDLAPTDGARLEAEVERLIVLGATPAASAASHTGGVALVDPDGRHFCVGPGHPASGPLRRGS